MLFLVIGGSISWQIMPWIVKTNSSFEFSPTLPTVIRNERPISSTPRRDCQLSFYQVLVNLMLANICLTSRTCTRTGISPAIIRRAAYTSPRRFAVIRYDLLSPFSSMCTHQHFLYRNRCSSFTVRDCYTWLCRL